MAAFDIGYHDPQKPSFGRRQLPKYSIAPYRANPNTNEDRDEDPGEEHDEGPREKRDESPGEGCDEGSTEAAENNTGTLWGLTPSRRKRLPPGHCHMS